jgi:DNA polymerase-3 subunit epsilon
VQVFFDMKTRYLLMYKPFFTNGREHWCCVQVLLWESLENAHSAEADTMATYEILKAQLDRYPELDNDMKSFRVHHQKENC